MRQASMKQGIEIKVALIRKGLTVKALAERIGIHPTKMSSIITGYIRASDEQKRVISKLLGRPINELFPS